MTKKEKSEMEMYKHANKVQAGEIQKYKAALIKISNLGVGLKESAIDWGSIGKSAVYAAVESLAVKCPTCGKTR